MSVGPPIGMCQCVCLSVCLSVFSLATYIKTTEWVSIEILPQMYLCTDELINF